MILSLSELYQPTIVEYCVLDVYDQEVYSVEAVFEDGCLTFLQCVPTTEVVVVFEVSILWDLLLLWPDFLCWLFYAI